MSLTPILAVVGATAAGKSDLALEVALRVGGEVINTDAMQLYRGMDVGTAKLPRGQRRGVPHHLLDLLEVSEPASVAQFQALARSRIADLRSRERVPVLVGGSALYTRAVLDRFDFPGTDPQVRARYEADLVAVGAPGLHRLLAERDPQAAAEIEPENGRRIVRALEVGELTGRSFRASLPEQVYVDPHTVQVGVEIDRPRLDERIALRVDAMFADGFVEEVRGLLAHGLAEGLTASRAIGYREVAAYLAGEITEQQARERTVTATRRFARRQDAWFRKDPRITWIGFDDPDRVAKAVAVLTARRIPESRRGDQG